MMHDFVLLITSVLFVSSLILVGFMLMCTRKLDTEVARKLVHILSSFWCLFLCEFRNIWWTLIGPIIFIIINTWFAFSNVSINVGFSDRRRNIGFSLYPVSAFFLMVVPNCEYGENGIFIFADSGLNANPTADELSEIAISSAESFKQLIGDEPKVAMLSYSTYGSAPESELTKKMIEATKITKEKAPDLLVDGELQLDAAIIPEIAESKAKGSSLKGEANILIFPNLDAGNIGYKLVQRLAKAEAYGPLCQGIAKPVNDLSRGCNSDDVAGVVAITAVQAQHRD